MTGWRGGLTSRQSPPRRQAALDSVLTQLQRLALIFVLGAAVSGCASLKREPFTAEQQALASPPGFEHVRWRQSDPALRARIVTALRTDAETTVSVLALSGGGANGAYSAGALSGWSAAAHRPPFRIVTGISTGALAATFAFLGPAWDSRLVAAYTSEQVPHLLVPRGVLPLFSPGLFRGKPLEDLVRSWVTEEMLHAVAAEHAKGRRLLVATTNLDTEELVVWDLGAIASQGGPHARDLFIRVLVASAAVPGVFPPSLIPVASMGHVFREMHVDGQTSSAFFAFPNEVLAQAHLPGRGPPLRLYVIVNGRLSGHFAVTPRATLPVLGRSFTVAAKAQAEQGLVATSAFCKAQGCDVEFASLPEDVDDDSLDFSLAHEKALIAAGEREAAAGRLWREAAAGVR